ncbi:helix-hairpin-helix domain-containing protein [uncultured Microbacterium sp.]|uniref:ComEA family DNA-binding protein n=1 Tax=uncultured Microbacterium sp. TaxID=191216 RepID=UPI0026018D59|nr:helix-hairpin-helix domain-containing protein [uncultured Microbacterium sp.]
MSTPEELLCSRKWRMAHGIWMLWGWFPFAWAAWVGYLIIGIKARSWKWIVTAAAFFAFGLTSMIMMSSIQQAASAAVGHTLAKGDVTPQPWSTYNTILFLVLLVVWIGNAAVAQWFVNRKWLVWRANHSRVRARPWYATATATAESSVMTIPTALSSPTVALDNALHLSPPTSASSLTPRAVPATPPQLDTAASAQQAPAARTTSGASHPAPATTPSQVDLNTATRDQLAALPGLDLAWADRIIAIRERIGGFASPADLVTAADVQPHVLASIYDRLIAVPQATAPSAPATGRRLEF